MERVDLERFLSEKAATGNIRHFEALKTKVDKHRMADDEFWIFKDRRIRGIWGLALMRRGYLVKSWGIWKS
jgi:hypothetical protein